MCQLETDDWAGILSLLSARSARGKRAFRAMSAGYEGRDFRWKSDCPSPVAYMYGSLRRGQRIEKRSDTTIVVLGRSSSDSRAGQGRKGHGMAGGGWQEGLVFLLPFTLLLAGAPAQILEM